MGAASGGSGGDVALPGMRGQGEAGSAHAQAGLRERHAGARVLVAEDNPVNRDLARAVLRGAGLSSQAAEDGDEAVQMALAGPFDLVLMDLDLPGLDGLEAARRIRALGDGTRPLPILALTAGGTGIDRAACLAAGMDDLLIKPFLPGDLLAAVLGALDRARARPVPDPAAGPPRAPPAADPDGLGALFVALQAVPGLDPVRGLGFFAGRRLLYLQALREFVGLYAPGLAGVEDYLARRPGATAAQVRREIHALGGAAAALGAVEIEGLAGRIAALLRASGPGPAGAAGQADDAVLRTALETVRQRLDALLARLRETLGHPAWTGVACA